MKSNAHRTWLTIFIVWFVLWFGLLLFRKGTSALTVKMVLGLVICSAFGAKLLYFLNGRKKVG